MKKYSFLNLVFMSVFLTVGQKDFSLKISIVEKRLPEKLIVIFTVISDTKKNLQVPNTESLVIGYKDDINSDCYFEVVNITNPTAINVIPTTDYQYFNVKNKSKLTVLNSKQSQSYKFNVTDFYKLEKDKKYKLRLIFRLSKYNPVSDAVSGWMFLN